MKHKIFYLFASIFLFLVGCSKVENDIKNDNNVHLVNYYGNSRTLEYPDDDYFSYITTYTDKSSRTPSYLITVLDCTSGYQSIWCGRAECTHSDETCDALINFYPENLFWNNEYVFVGGLEILDNNSTRNVLYRIDKSGSNKELLVSFESSIRPVGTYILGENYIYFDCYTFNEKNGHSNREIDKINIQSGKITKVYDLKSSEQLFGAYEDFLYINKFPAPDFSISTDILGSIRGDNSVYSIDLNGNCLNKDIISWAEGDEEVGIFANYLVELVKSERKIKVTNLSTNEISIYENGVPDLSNGCTIQFIDEYNLRFTAKTNNESRYLVPYMLDLASGKVEEITWKQNKYNYMAVDVVGQTANKYIIVCDYETIILHSSYVRPSMAEEGPLDFEIEIPVLAMIDKENYIKGIHDFSYVEKCI